MTEHTKRKTFYDYLPAIIVAVSTVFTLILYSTYYAERKLSSYAAMAIGAVAPFALVFVNRKCRLNLPYLLVCCTCLHIFACIDLGTVLDVYHFLPAWDLVMHGAFGILGAAILYYLILRFEGEVKAWHYLAIFLGTIAIGAIWEMYEFVADLLIHTDMQRVQEAIANGNSPIADTMTDMMIAALGAAVYLLIAGLRDFAARRRG